MSILDKYSDYQMHTITKSQFDRAFGDTARHLIELVELDGDKWQLCANVRGEIFAFRKDGVSANDSYQILKTRFVDPRMVDGASIKTQQGNPEIAEQYLHYIHGVESNRWKPFWKKHSERINGADTVIEFTKTSNENEFFDEIRSFCACPEGQLIALDNICFVGKTDSWIVFREDEQIEEIESTMLDSEKLESALQNSRTKLDPLKLEAQKDNAR